MCPQYMANGVFVTPSWDKVDNVNFVLGNPDLNVNSGKKGLPATDLGHRVGENCGRAVSLLKICPLCNIPLLHGNACMAVSMSALVRLICHATHVRWDGKKKKQLQFSRREGWRLCKLVSDRSSLNQGLQPGHECEGSTGMENCMSRVSTMSTP